MTSAFSTTTSRLALFAALSLGAPAAAGAASFTVPAGTTTTTRQDVSGTDAGVIESGGTLDVSGNAVRWNGNATGAGISVTNSGAIVSGGRGFDTDGDVTGAFTLTNDGTITSGADLFRVDTAFGNGVLTIVNTGSMTATSGQAFDFDGADAATAVVSIANTGSITAQANDAIRLGSGTISIVNSGVIQTTDPESRAVSFDNDGNIENLAAFTLTNEAAGRIIGTDDATKISADGNDGGSTISIVNRGLIDGGAGQALDFADLTAADNVITITNSGTIQSQTADAMRPGAFATVINSGVIQSLDLFSDGDGVDFQEAGGRVENSSTGRIIGAKHGVTGDGAVTVINAAGGLIAGSNGSGVNIDSTGDTVTTVINHGTIRGAATLNIDDDGDPDGVPDGDGDGIDVDGYLDLTNSGTVQGTGATGTNDGLPNTADGIAAGGGLITNTATGVIEAFDSVGGGVGRAILIDDSNQGPSPFATTITNAGVIRSDGVAVTLVGQQNDTIENAGTISSQNEIAVDMGGGNDRFVSHVGSQVIGAVSGGAGQDTLELGGQNGAFGLASLSDTGAYRGFETLEIGAAATYTATGTGTFAGTVDVRGGLLLNGSVASASAVVRDGGVLAGTGTIGALAFEQGSTFGIEIDGASTPLNAGAVTIAAGAAVEVQPIDVRVGQVYEVISAASVAGAFTDVSGATLFADPTLIHGPDSVSVAYERNGVAFTSVAESRNQRAVASALDGAGAGSALANTLAGATDANAARSSLDLLSGEAHASLGSSLFTQNALVADTILDRLRGLAPSSAPAAGGRALSYGEEPKAPAAFNDLKAPYAPSAGPVVSAWAQGFGQWSDIDGRRGSGDVDASLGGVLAGIDATSDGLTFGVAGGYVRADSDVNARRSSADVDTAVIAAYAGASFDAFRLRGGASYGWSEIDSRRTIVVGGLTERARADYDGSTANAFAEAAYALNFGAASVEPFAQIAWSRIETDAFSERNAPVAGLRVRGLDFDTLYTTLGARVAATFDSGFGTMTPHASLAWRHAMDDITPRVAAAFRNGGGDFTAAGAPIGKDSLMVQGGVDLGISTNVSVGVSYEGQFARDARTNAVKGRFAYSF